MPRNKFWMQFALVIAIVTMVCLTTYAQRGGGGGRGGFGGGRGGMGGGLFGAGGSASFALREDVRNELNLSERQKDELEEISQTAQDEQRSSMRELMSERMAEFRDMSANERQGAMQGIQKEIAKRNKKVRDQVVDVLSSQQKTRFDELEFQYNLQRGNAMAALTVADVELDEDDEGALRETMQEMQSKLRAEIARVTLEMQIEALATVMSKSKIQQLMGDAFQFDNGRGLRGRSAGGGPRRPRGGDDDGNVRRRRRPSSDDDDEQSPRPRNRRREP